MCCLRPILHWREIGFRVHLLVCSRRLNTTIWKSYILQSFYTFSGGDVNSLTKVHNSKWSTLKRTSSMPGNMNFMETGNLRWNFTFNNSLVGSNACNIAPWKLNIKVECPISLLPIAYCLFCLLPYSQCQQYCTIQAQYQSWMLNIPIALWIFCLLTYSLCLQYCTMQVQVLNIKVKCSIILKGGVWQISIKISKIEMLEYHLLSNTI